ncbi:hypothetical protein ACOSP7_003145 [Xanthoceras sorbifolium]
MGCTKEQMVTYSALLLKDRAKDWWKALQRIQPEGVSWANFRREFLEKFYPKSYRDARVKKFFRLEKGSLAIAEYEKTFLDLIRAVLFIADNEEQKANRYAVGLNPKIRAYVSLAAHTQFGPLVEAATSVERSMAANPRPKHQASVKLLTEFRGTSDSRRSFPVCNKCGNSHLGECQKGNTRCYKCGQEAHFFRDCPNVGFSSQSENRSQASGYTSGPRGPNGSSQPSGGTGRGGPPRGQPGRPHAQARVFAVTQQEADAAPEVVTVAASRLQYGGIISYKGYGTSRQSLL